MSSKRSSAASSSTSLTREDAGQIIERALRSGGQYDAHTRSLPGALSSDVFVDEKRTRNFLGYVMVVPNPVAPRGFYWSSYGPYAANISRVLRDAGFDVNEGGPRRGRASGLEVAPADRKKLLMAIYRSANVSDKLLRNGKHTVMLVGGSAERYGVPNYTNVVLEELDNADLYRLASARGLLRGRASGVDGGDQLFVGVFPGGISYADRRRERHGDYVKVAFLPYDTLEVEWSASAGRVPDDLRRAILAHVKIMQERRGQRFAIDAGGQSVVLGGGKPGRDAGVSLVVAAAVIVGALLLLRPLFKDAQEAHRWNMEHDPVYRRTHQATQIANTAANIGSMFRGNVAGRTNRRHVVLGLARHFDKSSRYAHLSAKQKALLLRFADGLLATGRATSTDALALAHGLAHTRGGVERLGRLGVRVTVADVLSGKLKIKPVPVAA